MFAPARQREILDSCRPPDVVVTDGAVGAVSVGVCSPPARLVTALRTRVAGRIEVRFSGAKDAVGRLFALAQALTNDYEQFEALVEEGEAAAGGGEVRE